MFRCPNCWAVLYEVDENLFECEICLSDFARWQVVKTNEGDEETDAERDPLSLVYTPMKDETWMGEKESDLDGYLRRKYYGTTRGEQ